MERIARSFDEQFSSVHAHGPWSLSDGRSRPGWPVATMNCVRVSHLFNVEAKMCRHPGVANHIRQDRCEDQLRTLKGEDDVPITLGNRMQSPQGPYRDRHTLASVSTEQPFPNELQAAVARSWGISSEMAAIRNIQSSYRQEPDTRNRLTKAG